MFRRTDRVPSNPVIADALQRVRESSRPVMPEQIPWTERMDALIAKRTPRPGAFRSPLDGDADISVMALRVRKIVTYMREADRVMHRKLTRVQRLASVQFFLATLPHVVTPAVYESSARNGLLQILGIDPAEIADQAPVSDSELEQIERLSDSRFMALIMSRQFGKTTIIAQCLAIMALVTPSKTVNIMAPKQAQAKKFVLAVRDMCIALGQERRLRYTDENCTLTIDHGDQEPFVIIGLPHNPKVILLFFFLFFSR